MSIKATARLSREVRLHSVTEYKLFNNRKHDSAFAHEDSFYEWYNCITMVDDKGREYRAHVRVGTEFQEAIIRKEIGSTFTLYCIPTDGQHANNALKTREHDGVRYVKVERCQLKPFAGKSAKELADQKARNKAARMAKLLGS